MEWQRFHCRLKRRRRTRQQRAVGGGRGRDHGRQEEVEVKVEVEEFLEWQIIGMCDTLLEDRQDGKGAHSSCKLTGGKKTRPAIATAIY